MILEKITFDELVAKLGQPEENQIITGTMGIKFSIFPCGCTRILHVGGLPYELIDEHGNTVIKSRIEFRPCEIHKAEFEGKEVE